MIDMLSQPVGAEHKAAGTKGALEQPLDRLGVLGRFWQNCKGQITHGYLLQVLLTGGWAR